MGICDRALVSVEATRVAHFLNDASALQERQSGAISFARMFLDHSPWLLILSKVANFECLR